MKINILSTYKNIIIGIYLKFSLSVLLNCIEHVKIKTEKSSILKYFQKLESIIIEKMVKYLF